MWGNRGKGGEQTNYNRTVGSTLGCNGNTRFEGWDTEYFESAVPPVSFIDLTAITKGETQSLALWKLPANFKSQPVRAVLERIQLFSGFCLICPDDECKHLIPITEITLEQ